MERYLTDTQLFYELKNKYETKYEKMKSKIIKENKNKGKKRELIKEIKRKCVNCGKPGGTIFSQDSENLYASCNAVKKCELKIKIKKAGYISEKDFSKSNQRSLEELKSNIVKNKLNLLYNLEKEDVVLAEFDSLKTEYQEKTNQKKQVDLFRDKKNTVAISDYLTPEDMIIVKNLNTTGKKVREMGDEIVEEDKDDEKKDDNYLNIDKNDIIKDDNEELFIFKNKLIRVFEIKIDNNVKIFKELISEYRNMENKDKTVLRNAMAIYFDEIIPNLKKLSTLKYDERYIQKKLIGSGGFGQKKIYEYILHNIPMSLSNCEIMIKEFGTEERQINAGKLNKVLNKSMRKKSKKEPKKLISKIPENETIEKEKGDIIDDMDIMEMQPERPDLYDDSTIFIFYSGSKDSRPGEGTAGGGEKIADPSKFEELNDIENWRRVLSNMHVKKDINGKVLPLFSLDGMKWASVEHWYHANKYKYYNDMEEGDENYDRAEVQKGIEFYRKFSLDSKSEFCEDPKKALTVGGRAGRLNNKKYRPKELKMDPDFFNKKKNEKAMLIGQKAKYEQDEFSKRVLLATKDAKLVHLEKRRGKKSNLVTFNNTMEIRESLKSKEGLKDFSFKLKTEDRDDNESDDEKDE